MTGIHRRAWTALALAAVAIGGCGAEEAPTAAAPSECLESWNAESIPQRFGRHVYDQHESAQAQVAMLQPDGPGRKRRR